MLYYLLFLSFLAKGENDVESEAITAWAYAQIIVKDKLESPSSADFCAMKDATIENDGDKYTITGYVDAQNLFGATIRREFTVTFTLTDSGCVNVHCYIV